eukprot:NODE_277_length_10928_cov_0.583987.p10 type:complete len:116 gc:universal NODE_277_length_10928_cov_0.583987:5492-5839(+)
MLVNLVFVLATVIVEFTATNQIFKLKKGPAIAEWVLQSSNIYFHNFYGLLEEAHKLGDVIIRNEDSRCRKSISPSFQLTKTYFRELLIECNDNREAEPAICFRFKVRNTGRKRCQ